MAIHESFVASVEDYIERSGTSPSVFGKSVLGDPAFVFRLRDGRSPSAKTIDKVMAWIKENPVEQS